MRLARKILGGTMIAAVFGGGYVVIGLQEGFEKISIACGVAILITALIYCGIHLLLKD